MVRRGEARRGMARASGGKTSGALFFVSQASELDKVMGAVLYCLCRSLSSRDPVGAHTARLLCYQGSTTIGGGAMMGSG